MKLPTTLHIVDTDAAPLSKMDQAFWTFHHNNPQVYDTLVAMTREAKHVGRQKIGIKMMFEVIRWQRMLTTRGDVFKLNNNYTSRYARIIEERNPDLAGMFEHRRIRS